MLNVTRSIAVEPDLDGAERTMMRMTMTISTRIRPESFDVQSVLPEEASMHVVQGWSGS